MHTVCAKSLNRLIMIMLLNRDIGKVQITKCPTNETGIIHFSRLVKLPAAPHLCFKKRGGGVIGDLTGNLEMYDY